MTLLFSKNRSFAFYAPPLATLLGILITLVIFYPGIISIDASLQLQQARTGIYTDWYPPVMGWLWSFLDFVIPGPGGLFLFHVLSFWVGLGIFTSLSVSNRLTAA